MKSQELTKKDTKDLNKTLGEKKEALRVFRFNIQGSKLKNVKEGKNLRKDIARILTEVNKK
jgi:ribosomal protein L29